MRLVSDEYTVEVARDGGRVVEGIVRARGFDARIGGRGAVIEWRDPYALLVRDGGRVTRLTVPVRQRTGMWLAFALTPIAGFILGKALISRRS
jgi:hypothetical protein